MGLEREFGESRGGHEKACEEQRLQRLDGGGDGGDAMSFNIVLFQTCSYREAVGL